MGDLSSSDCSWKKMVIAKANNKWISTLKLDHNEMESPVGDADISEQPKPMMTIVKIEPEEINNEDSSGETEIPMSFTQEVNPLELLQPVKRRRRKTSVVPKIETDTDRATRLAKMSAYAAHRLASETPEQRANRLKRMSEYAAKRLAHETSDQRARRLSRMSAYAAKRLANETPEQRQARLTRMSAYAAKRHAMKKNTDTGSAGFSENIQAFEPN